MGGEELTWDNMDIRRGLSRLLFEGPRALERYFSKERMRIRTPERGEKKIMRLL